MASQSATRAPSVDTVLTSICRTSHPSVTSQEEDDGEGRGYWSGRMDFVLSAIGYAVGLGNIWRFPYLCYRNGGGAFLVPYVITLACAGLPLFFFELALGQFASLGPITIWKISPAFKGLGYAMVVVSAMVCVYYNVIIGYIIRYFVASFTLVVPWATCDNAWNTGACISSRNANISDVNDTLATQSPVRRVSPAQEYWDWRILGRSRGIDELGELRWELVLSLLAAWGVTLACLIKGVKSTGKVVYFTALFPYAVLCILLVRGVTLPGSAQGVYFYIVPQWEKLKNAKVWGEAAVQIFYSLGPAWGGLLTMASYNRFHNNCYRDAVVVALINCGTSVFAGFVIFSVLGFMAHELGLPVDDVTDSGPGLALVTYPAGIAMMPVAPLWALLFFFMLFTLGLDSMFTMMETVTSAFADEFPGSVRQYKGFFTLVVCVIGFLLGLPMVTQGGMYLLTLVDWYSGMVSLLVISLCELVVVMYIYGYSRFSLDIKSMLGFSPNIYWAITWNVLTPLVIVFLLVFNGVHYTPVTYGDYTYPPWAEALGWTMAASSLVCIPIGVAASVLKTVRRQWGSTKVFSELRARETLAELFLPTEDWGPALVAHRRLREDLDMGTPHSQGTHGLAEVLKKIGVVGGAREPDGHASQIRGLSEYSEGFVNPGLSYDSTLSSGTVYESHV